MPSKKFKAGFVAIVGRPNAGKSTLLNSIIGQKVSIVSSVPQTTRYQIRGILNLKEAQIIFVDTPGIHSFHDELASYLNIVAKKSLEGCDLVLYVVDTTRLPGQEESEIADFLLREKAKVIMALNKIDLDKKFLNDYVAMWQTKLKEKGLKKDPIISYLPLSAKSGQNIDILKELLVENLPKGVLFYDRETLTDFPLKFRMADLIREKVCLNLKEELPHAVAVEIEETTDKKNVFYIRANVYLNRPSQKKIILGRKGVMLKTIGQEARYDLEKVVGKKVYLDLWVKVVSDWQKRPRILQELGYA